MQEHCIISPLVRFSLVKYEGERDSKCFYFKHRNVKRISKKKTHNALFYIAESYASIHYLRKYLEQTIQFVTSKIDPV